MLFFDEKSVLQMLEKYSEQPSFRNFFKKKIQEILEESGNIPKASSNKETTGKIDRDYIKGIVEEVIEEKGLKKKPSVATKALGKQKLGAIVFGIISLIRKQNIFLVSVALFVIFLVLGYIYKYEILWIIALIFVLVIIWISYSWKVTHRQIFGKKKHSL